MSFRVYRGGLLTPLSVGGIAYADDALVTVEDGRIESVRPFHEALLGRSLVHDLRPAVIVPGFVDAHVHYPQTRVIGRAGAPLLAWLEGTVFPEESRFASEAYAREVAASFVASLAAVGTTTASVYGSSHEGATRVLFEALAASGLRALAGPTLMDQCCPEALRVPPEQALPALERLGARWHGHDGGRLQLSVTPRFALSCSRPLMEGAARVAAVHGLPIQTHLSEQPEEGAAVLAEHPFASDYLGIYEAVGLLGGRTLLAHSIHLSASEWDRLAAAGARVAHCPDSNFFLGSGRMDLAAAHARGVPVALGSDVAAGRSFDMRRAMSYAYDNALCLGQRLAPEALLRLATLGGAEALGLDAVTGSLEEGKDADFLALTLPVPAASRDEVLAQVVFGDGVRVTKAFVRGKQVAG